MTSQTTPHPLSQLRSNNNPVQGRPWHVTWRDQSYTVAGDGYRILAVKGHLPQGAPATIPVLKEWSAHLAICFNPEREYTCMATLEQLLAFGGQEHALKPATCQRCGGQGPHCQGQAREGRNILVATYQGEAFNFSWVQEVLSGLDASQITVSRSGQILRIETDQWAYFQMAMQYAPDTLAKLPKLEEHLTGQK